MKEVFNKDFWSAVFSGGKQLAEAVALLTVSGIAIYFTKHAVESVLFQRVFFVAEGIVALRAGVEFVRHLAHQDSKGVKG